MNKINLHEDVIEAAMSRLARCATHLPTRLRVWDVAEKLHAPA
jgi:hypothetical protein